jgi:hypothetical protein
MYIMMEQLYAVMIRKNACALSYHNYFVNPTALILLYPGISQHATGGSWTG